MNHVFWGGFFAAFIQYPTISQNGQIAGDMSSKGDRSWVLLSVSSSKVLTRNDKHLLFKAGPPCCGMMGRRWPELGAQVNCSGSLQISSKTSST